MLYSPYRSQLLKFSERNPKPHQPAALLHWSSSDVAWGGACLWRSGSRRGGTGDDGARSPSSSPASSSTNCVYRSRVDLLFFTTFNFNLCRCAARRCNKFIAWIRSNIDCCFLTLEQQRVSNVTFSISIYIIFVLNEAFLCFQTKWKCSNHEQIMEFMMHIEHHKLAAAHNAYRCPYI